MSRYKAYLEYKDSGVVWLGRVPVHWLPKRFKQVVADKRKTFNPSLEAGSISFGRVVLKDSDNLSQETKDSYQEVLAGEYLVNPLNLNYDLLSLRTALSEIDVVVSTGYIVLKSTGVLKPRYIRWLLHEFDVSHMKTLGAGVRQTINYSDIGNSYFFAPTEVEQEAISNFLDHETAKIDALIEKQQRLIELLKEKRQAVISHAVTKGLNPNAPMQDSGVEWLGEVPAHWTMTKFHYEIDLLEGPGILANDFHDEGVPLLRIQNVKDEFVSSDYKTYLSPSKVRSKWDHFRVAKGDLIISCSATTGLVSEVAEDTIGAIPYTGLIRLRPQVKASITKEFIRCLVQSDLFFEQIKLLQSGSTIQHFGPYHLQQMHITLPTVTEQDQIAKTVKEKTARLDSLISIADQQIELMQERRTALISAAVTGKIDVRDWQAAA